MLKRLLDLTAALAGLLLLWPLFVVVALLVKLDSPGPVFYRQVRVGRHGKHFRIFKFRTMVTQQLAGAAEITVAGDARVTRVGTWLRRYKLDELPQLIDVLRGTMSLVGPRPEVPRYVALYPEEIRRRLLSVRPGITDFASVRYRNEGDLLSRAADPESEYVHVVLPTKLRYALHYVDNSSLVNDLRVLGLTLRTVFAPDGGSRRRQDLPVDSSPWWRWLDRQMSAIRPRRRVLASFVDAGIVFACWHLTYLFRLGFERWQPGRPWYDDYVSLGVVAMYVLTLGLAGVPRGLWRFFGFDDLRRIALACLLAGLISAVAVLMAQLSGVARAVLLLHPWFSIVGLSMARMLYRMLWETARARTSGDGGPTRRAIVVGAGDAGRRLIASLNRRDGWEVLMLLDDDPDKQGLRVAGVNVQGRTSDLLLPHIAEGATHIIVAMPDVAEELQAHVLGLARQTGLTVLRVASREQLQPDTVTR
ncbi:MAG: sugar transferase [Rubrivivax sp.]